MLLLKQELMAAVSLVGRRGESLQQEGGVGEAERTPVVRGLRLPAARNRQRGKL